MLKIKEFYKNNIFPLADIININNLIVGQV